MGPLSKTKRVMIVALLCYFACIAILLSAYGGQQTSKPAKSDPAQAEFFEAKVRPILIGSCIKCHSASNASGGLRLDTREGLLQGGGRGPVVAPRKPSDSLLLKAVSYRDSALKMPPTQPL